MCTGASERWGIARVLDLLKLLFVHCIEISLFAWVLNPKPLIPEPQALLKKPAALELHSNLRTPLSNKSCSFVIWFISFSVIANKTKINTY